MIKGLGEIFDSTVWDVDGSGPQPPILVIGGNFDHAGEGSGPPAHNIAAFNGNGWLTLGSGISNGPNLAYVSAVTTYDGDLIAAGYFTRAGGQSCANIARWDGSAWHPLGSGIGAVGDSVQALAVYNGDLIAAGSFDTAGGVHCANIARWNGATWQPLGSGISGGYVYALTAHENMLIAGGGFDTAGNHQANHVASWDGTDWQPVGAGIDVQVASLTEYAGELIAGRFGYFGTAPVDTVVRWDGADWQPLGTGVGNAPEAGALSMTVFNNELIVGGYFSAADGAVGNNISRWDGSVWHALGTGTDNLVEALSAYNGQLVAGGNFENAGPFTVESIARWNGTSWIDLAGVSQGPGGTILSMTPWAGGMVLGGTFLISANGIANDSIANLAYFDGQRVRELENAALPVGFSWVTAMTTSAGASASSDLIIGGYLTSIGGTPVTNIARLNDADGEGWKAMGDGLNETVWALERFEGSVYAGGQFTASNITPLNHLARWDGQNWQPVGPGPVDGVNGEVMALEGFAVNSTTAGLVVGGSFTAAGGSPANSIALLTHDTATDSTSWAAMGAGFNNVVRAIAYFNGSVYAAGDFTASGATPINYIARWNGSNWVPVTTGMNGPVRSLTVSNGTLVVGGDFTLAGGIMARHLARWNGTAWTAIGGHTDGPVYALATLQDEIHIGGEFQYVRNSVLHSPIWARYSEHGTPWIAVQPQSAERPCHGNFVGGMHPAQGYGGLVYQWRKNGVPLVDGPTGTGSTIIGSAGNFGVLNVSDADEGVYDCVLSNGCGSVLSAPATLTVIGRCPGIRPPAPKAANPSGGERIEQSPVVIIR